MSAQAKTAAKSDRLIRGATGDWEVVIGMEVHAQVTSKSKLFSGASTEFGGAPNSHVSLVDAAMPGMLPVINEECVRQAIRTGLGLKAKINLRSVFDRKNYFYPDLPQGYQISQYKSPVVGEGVISVDLEGGDECFLWYVDLAELPHALFPFLLLVEQLALACGVAAVALGGDILAEGAHRFARDDLAADRGLDRYLEHMRRNELLELLRHGTPARFGARPVHKHGQRVNRVAVDQHLQLHEVRRPVIGEVIVERGVAA